MDNNKARILNFKGKIRDNNHEISKLKVGYHYLKTALIYMQKNKKNINPTIMAIIFNKVRNHIKDLPTSCQLSDIVDSSANHGVDYYSYIYNFYQLEINDKSSVNKLYTRELSAPFNVNPYTCKQLNTKKLKNKAKNDFLFMTSHSLVSVGEHEKSKSWHLFDCSMLSIIVFFICFISCIISMAVCKPLIPLLTKFFDLSILSCFIFIPLGIHYDKWHLLTNSKYTYKPTSYDQFLNVINQSIKAVNKTENRLIKNTNLMKHKISKINQVHHNQQSLSSTMDKLKSINDEGTSWDKIFAETKQTSKA